MPDAASPTAPASKAKKQAPKYPTWEHPKGSGIKIAEMPNRTGGKVFGVSYQIRIPSELLGEANKRELLQRRTKAEAERLAEDRFLSLKKHDTEFAKIPSEVQKQAAIAWSMLNEHNLKTRLSLSILDVVKAGMRVLSPTGGLKTFVEVCAELRASKSERFTAGGLDASTERDFRNRSSTLEAHLGEKLVSQITAQDVEKTLRGMGASLSRRSVLNYRNTLSEIFRHAKAKQYSPTNPMENFAREDFKNLGGEKAERAVDDINVLTVAEARSVLNAARAHSEAGMLATVILRLFCGLRTAEACRLDWSEVHWTDAKPYVHIPAGKAKKRRIRHVDIPANAIAWLNLCNPPASGTIAPGSPKGYTRRFGRVARLANIGSEDKNGDWQTAWENNDTRHSFASYHYALHGDALATAKQLGHKASDDVLFAHYRSLVKKEEAEAYFSILPTVGAENITAFPKAAQGATQPAPSEAKASPASA